MGAKVSSELVVNGIIAVILSVLGIMVYIWLRFEWQFGLGAAASLLHDAIVVVGLFSLFQLEFDLTIVAAVLTVIGYSINDTVVVFDRARGLAQVQEDAARRCAEPLVQRDAEPHGDDGRHHDARLLAIYFFGGPTVDGFAFAVIFGIIIGSYSSIYVASASCCISGSSATGRPGGAAGTSFGSGKA